MLTAKSLSCRRGRRLVFRGLDFSLEPGGMLLITGRNGSGKSSLLRVLAGLLPPHEGGLSWQSRPIKDMAAHRARLHYIGHLDGLKPELTVNETVRYWCALYRIPAADIPESFSFEKMRDVPTRYLSAGQKRRLALVRLVLRKAPLWLLDEPSTSLDEDGQELLTNLIRRHRAEDGMIALASHHKSAFRDATHITLEGAAA